MDERDPFGAYVAVIRAVEELVADAREGDDLDRLNELERLRGMLWREHVRGRGRPEGPG